MKHTKLTICCVLIASLLGACANDLKYRDAKRLQAESKPEEAMALLESLTIEYPQNTEYQTALATLQERQANRLLTEADNYRITEDFANAAITYNKVLKFQPNSPRA